MPLTYLFDHNVNRAIALGLRRRGVDVITAQEDGSDLLDDPDLLDRATELGRVLFTSDDDLLREGHQRQAAGIEFNGVVFAKQNRLTVGQTVDDLEILAEAGTPEDVENRVVWVPL